MEKFAGLMDWAELNRLLSLNTCWTAQTQQLYLDRRPVPPETDCRMTAAPGGPVAMADPGKVHARIAEGATLIANAMDSLSLCSNQEDRMMAKIFSLTMLLILSSVQAGLAGDRLENREDRASINGIDHWYRVAGARNGGIPIVVVHGGPGGNVYSFEHTTGPRLELFATMVYYEQRGSGRSGRPADDGAYSIELITSDLHALLDALHLEKVMLLGFSFGGELALEYAIRHPQRVEKLILSSTSAGDYERMATVQTWGWLMIHEGETRAKLDALSRQPVKSALKRLNELWSLADAKLSDRFLFHNAEAAKTNRRLWDESGRENTGHMAKALLDRPSRRSPSLMDDIRRLNVPALVIAGLHDRNIGVDMIRDVAQSLPDAQFVLFENSAHFPDIEEPEKFARVVKTFIAE